jgi:hypothetical protein
VKWLAILLALASMGGGSTKPVSVQKCKSSHSYAHKHRSACKKAIAKAKKQATQKPSAPSSPNTPSSPRTPTDPDATPTPTATATPKPGTTPTPPPTVTPTPTAKPCVPRRTAVDLLEYEIRSSYGTAASPLCAGAVTFNANNIGEDEHNLTAAKGDEDLGVVTLASGDAGPLVVDLPAGTYTLYCSLEDHAKRGMKLDITVR